MMVVETNTARREAPNMFTITNKIRTIVAIGVTGAALASASAASAQNVNAALSGSSSPTASMNAAQSAANTAANSPLSSAGGL
jgi:hypothetical protein